MPTKIFSPIRYPGGKSLAVPLIQKHLRKGVPLVSPFFGGGSIEFNHGLDGTRVYGYDTYQVLVCFYDQLRNNNAALKSAALSLCPLSPEQFKLFQETAHEMPDGPDKAAAYFALNYSSYMSLGQSGGQTKGHERFNKHTIHQRMKFNMHNVTVDNMDYRDSLTKHSQVFAFLDPPYIMKKKSDEDLYGFNGSHHRNFNHSDLFEELKDRDNWIMTHRDCEDIRHLYRDFPFEEMEWRYTMSDRMGKELLIKSRDHLQIKKTYAPAFKAKYEPETVISTRAVERWREIAQTNRVALAMEKAMLDIDSVLKGRNPIAILSGAPGVGKSRLLHDCSARMKRRKLKTNFYSFSNVRDLVDAISDADGKSLIVADEADSLLRSKPQIEMLKLLADPHYKLPLTTGSGKNKRILKLTCPIILAFNADIVGHERAIQVQLDALWSRKRPVRVGGNREEMWEYSVHIALTSDLLKNYTVGKQVFGGSLSCLDKAITIFTNNVWNLEEISPRALKKIYHLICLNAGGHLTDQDMQTELHSLMAPGAPQNTSLPKQEDWGAIRKEMIAWDNQRKNQLKTELPDPHSVTISKAA